MITTLTKNASFIMVALGITMLIVVMSIVYQRFCIKDGRSLRNARSIAYIALFSALAAILMLIEIPLFFAPEFYKLDLSEIAVLICAFYLGPVAGVISELLKIVLHLLFKGTTTALVGEFSNFLIGCSMILPASIVYHYRKSKKAAVIGLGIGTIVMTAFGSFFNAVYLIPKYSEIYGLPLDSIIEMGSKINPAIDSLSKLVIYATVPFNLLKGILVSVLTFLLYKRVEKLLLRK